MEIKLEYDPEHYLLVLLYTKNGHCVGGEIKNNGLTDIPGIDAIEALVLAHAYAGVAIEADEYVKGFVTAIDAILNNADEDEED